MGDFKRAWRAGKTTAVAHLDEVSRDTRTFKSRKYANVVVWNMPRTKADWTIDSIVAAVENPRNQPLSFAETVAFTAWFITEYKTGTYPGLVADYAAQGGMKVHTTTVTKALEFFLEHGLVERKRRAKSEYGMYRYFAKEEGKAQLTKMSDAWLTFSANF